MIPVIPWYLVILSVAINLAIAVGVWQIFSSAAGRSGLTPSSQRSVRAGSAIFLAAWLGAALFFAPAPASLLVSDPYVLNPLIPAFLILPPTIVLVALWRSPALRQVFAVASLPALIGIQFYRVMGIVFLILLALGQTPAYFALPAGWGDIGIGLAAPLVAFALARGVQRGRSLAIAWNVFGLFDLFVAVGMGTGFLAPLLVPNLGPQVAPVAVMGVFPMMVVPTFAVPVSVLLHLAALTRLRRPARLGSRVVPEVSSG